MWDLSRTSKGFTDGFVRSVGATGQTLSANALSIANIAWRTPLTWNDPDVNSLEAHAETPLFSSHPIEMGSEPSVLEAYISEQKFYAEAFIKAFPDVANPYTVESILSALAVHQRRIVAVDAPFDRELDGEDALSESARRGYALFQARR